MKIINQLNLKDLKDPRSPPKQFTFWERQEFFLEGLYLTGKKKAEQLIDRFGPSGFVINALLKSNVIYSSF
jgi:hypothetical protein